MPKKNPNRVKRQKKYDEDTLKKAIATLSERENLLSVREIAKMYKIPVSTLSYRYSGKSTQYNGHPRGLTCDEERELVEWIETVQKSGINISKYEVCLKVKEMLDTAEKKSRFTNNLPGQEWWKMFKLRHKDLKFKRCLGPYAKYRPSFDGLNNKIEEYKVVDQNGNVIDQDNQDDNLQVIIQVSDENNCNDISIQENVEADAIPYSETMCDDLFFLSVSERIKSFLPVITYQLKVLISQYVESIETSIHSEGIDVIEEDTCESRLTIVEDVSRTKECSTADKSTNSRKVTKTGENNSLSSTETLSNSTENFYSEPDYYDKYFLSLSKRVKSFPVNKLAQLKIQIQALIQDTEKCL